MKEAMFYSRLKNKIVKCSLCARRCTIPEDKTGFCLVRKNVGGKLYSLVYGKACSANVDPIEKKPLYHFWPGSKTLSVATVGCNFRCKYCCNYEISHEKEIYGENLPPTALLELAQRYGVQGFSYTYTEPTIFFEYAHDTAKLTKPKGFYQMFVTNGYTTPEAIKVAAKWLDAATIDFKASANPKFYKEFASVPKVQPIFDALLEYKRQKIHIEVTDLLVPKVGDKIEDVKKLVKWIHDNLGAETPLHFLRFFPSGEMLNFPQTPAATVEKARQLALKMGMKYVYSGNIPGSTGENTLCPKCGSVVIERFGFSTSKAFLKDKSCAKCGESIPIVGKVII